MSDQIMGEATADAVEPPTKAVGKMDPGFKRNLWIVGSALGIAVVVIAAVVIGARSKIDANKNQIAPTNIPNQSTSGAKPAALNPADEERLNRVQGKESDEAKAKKDTYIPKDNPMKSDAIKAPDAQTDGPGAGYNYSTGNNNANGGDAARDGNIRKGIEMQLAALLARNEPPPTQKAPGYANDKDKSGAASTAGAAAAVPATTTAATTTPEKLIGALNMAGARLVSPLDTARTGFISAEITAGPLTGAYVVGLGKMSADEGVSLKFTRMKFRGEDYVIDATGLDSQTSSDAMNAEIDRKILSRYVMPILFTSVQAYMTAIAKPATAIVGVGTTLTTAVTTPAATTLQATASGVSAGLGKAIEKGAAQNPSAYLPIDYTIALLFNESVLKKAAK